MVGNSANSLASPCRMFIEFCEIQWSYSRRVEKRLQTDPERISLLRKNWQLFRGSLFQPSDYFQFPHWAGRSCALFHAGIQ